MWPALAGDALDGWTIGVVTTVIGGAAELVGVRARLFFVPIWLIGVGVVSYQLGLIGTVVFVVIVVAGAVWWSKRSKATARSPFPPHCSDRAITMRWKSRATR